MPATPSGHPRSRTGTPRSGTRRAARGGCIAAVLVLSAGTAGAGLSIDDALARDRALAAGDSRWADLEPPTLPTGLTLAAGGPARAMPALIAAPLPGRGGFRAVAEGPASGGLRFRLGLSGRVDGDPPFSLEGSAAAFALTEDAAAGEAYVSVERRHWGPGWAGSLILDAAASALPAAGVRRRAAQPSDSPWLAWMGAWTADAFIGSLQGHEQPERPWLVGLRLQFEPVDGLLLGLSRTLQWGGAGRDESLSSLLRAMLGNDNVGFGGIDLDNEPGNQLAGLDVRWRPAGDAAWSLYGQLVGEDEAGHLPSRNLILVGADARLHMSTGPLRLFAEWTDLLAGRVSGDPRYGVTYRHRVYRAGYTHEGRLLGHPAGGDVRLASAGLLLERGTAAAMLVASAGRAESSAQRLAPGAVSGIDASVQARLGAGLRVGAVLSAWRDPRERRAAAQLWCELSWP
jgi:hypothetical protein